MNMHSECQARGLLRGIIKRPLAVLSCIFIALLFHCVAVAEDASVVRSEGAVSGVEAGAGSDAREMALQSAIKNAVGSALDALMKRESVDLDPSVTRSVDESPMSYVLNYRVVSEGWAALPDQAAVQDGQQALAGAQKEQAGQAPPGRKDQTTEPSSDAQAVNTGEYRVVVEVSVDSVRLRALVAEAISGGGTAEVAVRIVDITDYAVYRTILDSLGRIALIKEISYGSFSRGEITLSVRTAASSGTLLERIAKEVGDRHTVEPGGSGTIIIRPLRAIPGRTGKST